MTVSRTIAPGARPRRVPGAREQGAGTTRTLLHEDGARVRRTVLPGGLRVVTENVPGVRSAAFGIWVGVGSRDETPAQAGAAHYLEHLLFKGTPRRSALDISAAIDAVGGEMNAFTSKEYTCFYARVLDADLPLAVDVVSDMVTSALLRSFDVDAERDVILEEIAMRDDDPGDLVHEEFADAMFGRPRSAARSSAPSRRSSRSRPARSAPSTGKRYQPENMVVAAAGNVDHAAGRPPGPRRRSTPPACSTATRSRRCTAPAPFRTQRRRRRPRAHQDDRAGQRRARASPASPATTTAGSPSACSTPPSAAA